MLQNAFSPNLLQSPKQKNMVTSENETPFDILVENLRILFDNKADLDAYNMLYQQVEDLAAATRKVVREDVTSPLTDEALNLQYPEATSGMQVICPYVAGGGELYEKFNDVTDNWFRLYMTKGGGSSSNPGIMQGLVIENFV